MILEDATPDNNWILQFPIWVIQEEDWHFSPVLDKSCEMETSKVEIRKHVKAVLWTVEPDELNLILAWFNSNTELAERVNKLLKNIHNKNTPKKN